MTPPRIRVVLADDHPAMRAGLRALLEATGRVEVVAEASAGGEAIEAVQARQPDVLVLDMELPDLSGVEVAERLAGLGSATRILAFSAHDDPAYVSRLLQLGAAGYITKDKAPAMVVEAVQAVARGEGRWFVTMARPDATPPGGELSTRETEVLRAMARGGSNDQIAGALHISANTVRNHISSIYQKLGVHSWREAVAWAWERGLVGRA